MNKKLFFSHKSDHWETPAIIYNKLHLEFNFNDDPCPLHGSDGLIREWNTRVFINPPYSNIKEFLIKGIFKTNYQVLVYLLPVRTDTEWFHDLVLPYYLEIRFIKGRLKFSNYKSGAPFPSMIVVF